jgi:hypothetical protein
VTEAAKKEELIGLREPSQVMRLDRMGASFPSRLSFARRLLRKLAAAGATVRRDQWQMDEDGYGRARFCVQLFDRTYTLCCFSQALDPAERTDRVIAEAWDAAFVLFDGAATDADMDRLAAQTPLQEAGRFDATDLIISRANKSLRMFEHVVESLAGGNQPDESMVRDIGYLMRTTAVYGNGKFGSGDRARIAKRAILDAPFQAELLTVYLIRAFTHDLVEHIAKLRAPQTAIKLGHSARVHLGVGNATGLGMAPFLVLHPILIHHWVVARERALQSVRQRRRATPEDREAFFAMLAKAQTHVSEWQVDDEDYTRRIGVLSSELETIAEQVNEAWFDAPLPWNRLFNETEAMSLDAQEFVSSLLIDLHPEAVDDLADQMASVDRAALDPAMPVEVLAKAAREVFGWVRDINFSTTHAQAQFWYVSEEKLEPRLGFRFEEDGAELEMPLAIARDATALIEALATREPGESTARFVIDRPDLRNVVRRLQTAARYPYAEIRDNLISAACRPVDMLRFKLAFFGASKFDPRSDRWTRINLYQGAPTVEELNRGESQDWAFPTMAEH